MLSDSIFDARFSAGFSGRKAAPGGNSSGAARCGESLYRIWISVMCSGDRLAVENVYARIQCLYGKGKGFPCFRKTLFYASYEQVRCFGIIGTGVLLLRPFGECSSVRAKFSFCLRTSCFPARRFVISGEAEKFSENFFRFYGNFKFSIKSRSNFAS